MTLHYETAGEQDIQTIYDFSKALIDRYEDKTLIDYEKVLSWVRCKIEKQIGQYTCIFANGQKVGFYRLDTSRERAELDDLYILPQYRGQGIGTSVLRKCIASAQKPIFVYVFKKNTGAIALYRRMGFAVEKDVGLTRCIMVRDG